MKPFHCLIHYMGFLIFNHYPEQVSGSFTILQVMTILGITQDSATSILPLG